VCCCLRDQSWPLESSRSEVGRLMTTDSTSDLRIRNLDGDGGVW